MTVIDNLYVVMFSGWVVIMMTLMLTLYRVRQQHAATNSRLDELIRAASALARLEGFEAGKISHGNLKNISGKLDAQSISRLERGEGEG